MSKIGLLLLNTGTPEKADKDHVAKYLREFLMDPRVIDLPRFIRWPLVQGFIIPTRLKSSTKAYQKIWTKEGSPLLVNSLKLRDALAEKMGADYQVELGMRYGKPSIAAAMEKLQQAGCEKLMIFPLFPQYASASTGSAVAACLKMIEKGWNVPSLNIVTAFYDDAGFIDVYAKVIKECMGIFHNQSDFILFSYHGLPERHIQKSECQNLKSHQCDSGKPCPAVSVSNAFCYRAQCYTTSRLLAEKLALTVDQYDTAFQSRLGKTPWIKPYSDEYLLTLRQKNIKNLWVVCPSFTADCLETLEEVGIRLKEQWYQLGGENFTLIPCLNADEHWVEVLHKLVKDAF